MLELGWIIPRTEEEMEIAERGLKDVEIPPFDFEKGLEDIKRRIRMAEQTPTTTEEFEAAKQSAENAWEKADDAIEAADNLGENETPEKEEAKDEK